MADSRKRKVLTLEDRVKVIKLFDSGKSGRQIPESLDVGKTQIQNIINEHKSVMDQWHNGASVDQKYVSLRTSLQMM